MIGNDIVDLKIAKAENKSENNRFLNKVFTEQEQGVIRSSSNPEAQLWVFWSMKETAYKAHQRIFKLSRKIEPLSFDCYLDEEPERGYVQIGGNSFPVRLQMNSEYIYCQTGSINSFHKIFKDKESRSMFVNEVATKFECSPLDIRIEKDENGIPSLYFENSPRILPISISHHGRFTAFLIPLINS